MIGETQDNTLIILMPVYNDWAALALLLPALDRALSAKSLEADVLVVDDGSTEPQPEDIRPAVFAAIKAIDILSLRRNLGHQRAIAIGLSYLEANGSSRPIVIMDSDGEDDPRDIARLVEESKVHRGETIVFAARTRRSEKLIFRFLYQMYRLLHFLLTGIHVCVGNFSLVPSGLLKRLVAVSELWNHYAAAVYKARLPVALVPVHRGRRLQGSSQMNIVNLVVHGLSAMAVFGDRIGVRLLIVVGVGMVAAGGALIAVLAIRFFTSLAIPGWATYAAGLLLVMLIQMLMIVLVFAFVILAARDSASVIPSRDFVHVTGAIRRLYDRGC
ncbi:MAG TPA: glycosyltransferase [Candidatus Eisenbacteria bacterium]|nr:glycosyltransferase [Candidatus Eisenbacteria bacterium]